MTTATANPPPRLPATLAPEDVVALIDTREQTPWNLHPLRTKTATLTTGDYSIRGLESIVAIERKSLSDLISCVGCERERFEREVARLLAFPVCCLIVEATWVQLESGGWRSRVTPQSAVGSVLGWIAMGLPTILAGDFMNADRYAARLLYTAARRRYRECRALAGSALDSRNKG